MACKDKITNICEEVYATCVNFRGTLPEFSELECPTIENTTQELYDTVSQIKEDIDLSAITGCINFPQGTTVKEAFQLQQTFICGLQTTLQVMQAAMDAMEEQIQDLQQNNCP